MSLVIAPEPIEGIKPLVVTAFYTRSHAAWADRVSAGSFGS